MGLRGVGESKQQLQVGRRRAGVSSSPEAREAPMSPGPLAWGRRQGCGSRAGCSQGGDLPGVGARMLGGEGLVRHHHWLCKVGSPCPRLCRTSRQPRSTRGSGWSSCGARHRQRPGGWSVVVLLKGPLLFHSSQDPCGDE